MPSSCLIGEHFNGRRLESDDTPRSYIDIAALLTIITLDHLFSHSVLLHVPLYHDGGKPIIAQCGSPTTAAYNLTSLDI
jgi:hypothetical protein